MIFAGVSARKTGLEQYATQMLLQSGPTSWQNREILMTDGTKKGVEQVIVNQLEGVISSSEGSCTIFVPGYSDKESGIQCRGQIFPHTQTFSLRHHYFKVLCFETSARFKSPTINHPCSRSL